MTQPATAEMMIFVGKLALACAGSEGGEGGPRDRAVSREPGSPTSGGGAAAAIAVGSINE
uniref:Uncharacterized protein MANES_16G014000 n=1 Tax=Rhizophora mucronata TaxID=61149 RepID=A0A2P2L5A1_RHIMU